MNLKEVKHIVYINTLIYISIFIFFIISLLFILFGPLNVGARGLSLQCVSGDYSNCFAAYSGTSSTSLNTSQSITNNRTSSNYNVLSITSVLMQPNTEYNFTLSVASSSPSFKLNNTYLRMRYENIEGELLDGSGYINTSVSTNNVTAQGTIYNIKFNVKTLSKFTNSTSGFFINFIFNSSGYNIVGLHIDTSSDTASGVVKSAIDTMQNLFAVCYNNLWYDGDFTTNSSGSVLQPITYSFGPSGETHAYFSATYNLTFSNNWNGSLPSYGSNSGFRLRFFNAFTSLTGQTYLKCDDTPTCSNGNCSCSGSFSVNVIGPVNFIRLYNSADMTTTSASVRVTNFSLTQGLTPHEFSPPGEKVCNNSYLEDIKNNVDRAAQQNHQDLSNIDNSIQSGNAQQHQDLNNINNSINETNNYLKDNSNPQVDSQGINNTMNSVQTSNPLAYLLTLPTNLLSTILQGLSSNTCTDFIIGKFGTIGRHDLGNYTFKFPCIDLEDKLGRDLWGTIDIFVAIGIIVVTIVKLYNTISNYLTLGAEEEVKSHSHFLSPMDFLGNVLGGNWSGVVSTTKGEF